MTGHVDARPCLPKMKHLGLKVVMRGATVSGSLKDLNGELSELQANMPKSSSLFTVFMEHSSQLRDVQASLETAGDARAAFEASACQTEQSSSKVDYFRREYDNRE